MLHLPRAAWFCLTSNKIIFDEQMYCRKYSYGDSDCCTVGQYPDLLCCARATAAVQKELSHCLVCQFSALHLPNTDVHVEAGLDGITYVQILVLVPWIYEGTCG